MLIFAPSAKTFWHPGGEKFGLAKCFSWIRFAKHHLVQMSTWNRNAQLQLWGKMNPLFNVALMLFYIFYPKFSCGVWSYLRNKKIGQERDLDFTMVVLQFSRPSSSPHKAGRRQLRPFEGGRQCAHACQCAFHSCLLITANKRPPQRNAECASKEILNARGKKYWMHSKVTLLELIWSGRRQNQ